MIPDASIYNEDGPTECLHTCYYCYLKDNVQTGQVIRISHPHVLQRWNKRECSVNGPRSGGAALGLTTLCGSRMLPLSLRSRHTRLERFASPQA
jgi:hypothetical protein